MREDPALRMPWAGIFEPWRPFVLIAMAADEGPRMIPPARPRKMRARRLRVLPGQMAIDFEKCDQGELFDEIGAAAPVACDAGTTPSAPVAMAKIRAITAADPITDEDVPF